jgi:hypothetical protein
MIPLVLGGLGAVGGGLGGAALAGRYMPAIAKQAVRTGVKAKGALSGALRGAAEGMEQYGAGGPGAIGAMATDLQGLLSKGADVVAGVPVAALGRGGAVAGNIAAGALGAGAGGAALGGLGQMFTPQEEAVDPESYGSSNSQGARYKTPTMQYV